MVARVPLIRTFVLDALTRKGKTHAVVIIAEKEALARGANVCSITFDLDGIVALTVPLDPTSGGRLGYAPGRVVLGASVIAWG